MNALLFLMSKKIKNNQMTSTETNKPHEDVWAKLGKLTLIIGLMGGCFKVGCVYTEHKKNLEYLRIENERQRQQQSAIFELQEKILNLEQDLRDCENERKHNEKGGAKISNGDK